MGEYADLEIDRLFDKHYFGDEDDEEEVCCNRCGEPGLYWQQVGGGWRLFDTDNAKPHVCKAVDVSDDFEVLP